MKKYELTNITKKVAGKTLYRIKALVSFGNVSAGELGGYVEKESNLSHEGDAWIADNACVYGNACVSNDARVYENAWVCGNAWVSDYTQVYGDSLVSDNALVFGNAKVYGDARVLSDANVYGNAQVYDNAWVSNSARVYGDAKVYGNAWVYENACVCDNARVCDNAEVYGNAQVYDNTRVGGNSQLYEKNVWIVFEVNSPELSAADLYPFVISGAFETYKKAIDYANKIITDNIEDGYVAVDTIETYETGHEITITMYKDGNEDSLLWTEIHIKKESLR